MLSVALRLFGLLIFISMVAKSGMAEVIISEIMYNPDGSDTEVGMSREWVELFNTGSNAVDLSGWILADLQDNQIATPLPSGTSLAAGEAIVLTGDAATFDAKWNSPPRDRTARRVELGNFPSLANSPSPTNEIVGIRDATGLLIDEVNYDDTGDWPRDSPDGSSIMLLPQHLSGRANNLGTAWKPSMGGVYGGRYVAALGGQDRASPGFVETVPQSVFTPSPDAAWSMVVLPDTQAYVKSSADSAILTQMTQWVVDQKENFGIEFVLHEGDIVNQNSQVTPTSGDQSGTQQWQNAKAAMSLLDGVVPYAISPGNHDYGTTNAQDRSTQYNTFFKQDDNPLVDPLNGGTLQGVMTPGKLDNAIHTFTAPDGRKMLVLATEWGPRQAAVDWANRSLRSSQYADHTGILLTHAYMYHDETRLDWQRNLDADPNNNQGGNPNSYPTANDTHDGEQLWQELVSPNGVFEMTFSGHIGGDGVGYLVSRGERDQTVHQMLFNSQFEPYGGNGWLRVLEFLDDGRTVRVRTYSPFHDLQKTNMANAFEFAISPLLPGDYNDDGTVDAADYTVWRTSLGQSVSTWSSADGNGDGLIDEADFRVWRSSFLASSDTPALSQAAKTSVPEPATWLILAAGAAILTASRRNATYQMIQPNGQLNSH